MPCGLVAVPVGEGAGDVETGADGDRVLGEPRLPPGHDGEHDGQRGRDSDDLPAPAPARGATPGRSPGLMPAIAVLPSGKEAAADCITA